MTQKMKLQRAKNPRKKKEKFMDFSRPRFYADKRCVASAFVSLLLGLVTQSWGVFLVSYAITASALDWWFFSYCGFKESHTACENYLRFKNITAEDLNSFSDLFVMARRVASLAAGTVGLIGYIMKWDIGWEIPFFMTYTGVNLLSDGYRIYNQIPYPFLALLWDKESSVQVHEDGSITSRQQPKMSRRSDEKSMIDPTNPIGLTYPASPRYIWKK